MVFLHLLENLISKVQIFGLHFASLDVRQDSSVHEKVLEAIAVNNTYFTIQIIMHSVKKKKLELLQNLSATSRSCFSV